MTEPDVDQEARDAARFFHVLIEEGVPAEAAIRMASSFVYGVVMADRLEEPPDLPNEPWKR